MMATHGALSTPRPSQASRSEKAWARRFPSPREGIAQQPGDGVGWTMILHWQGTQPY
jgi:hypothetical protein